MVKAPEYETRPEIKLQQRRGWMLFLAGASLTPLCLIVGCLVSGQAQHSLVCARATDWLNSHAGGVITLSFLACIGAPLLFADTLPRKVTLAVYATGFHFVDLVASVVICITIFGTD